MINLTTHEDILLLEIDNPPVNALGPGVSDAIIGALGAAERDEAVNAIVFKGAGRTFVAGADIAALEEAAWGSAEACIDLHDLLARVEDFHKPIVMAIHGTAFGGGLELAMAGHYRVTAPDALLGQPEVNLGLIPGAEGTQRLPRLVGVEKALDMCVTGRPITGRDGLSAGLVDAVIEGDLVAESISFAREVLANFATAHRRTRDRTERLGSPDENAPLFDAARALAAKIRRRQFAPSKVIDAIEAATTLDFAEGCRRERELFVECVRSEQAKALIHLFFAERAASKLRDVPTAAAAAPIARVAVIGAGTMGGGIAMACANAGLPVTIRDASQDALDAGIAKVQRNYESSAQRGRLTPAAVADRLSRIRPTLSDEGIEDADLVIEAVFENLELKKEIFRELDGVAKPSAVLATNTSTLDIDEIAGATSRPGQVLGLHFFSPAHVMRLLEIVRGRATDAGVLATALGFAKRIGKVAVVVGNCHGFVGNRMMFPYMYEAQFLVEEGATPEQVDRALTDFGMAMGIFAVDDMAGIDVAWRVRQELGHFGHSGTRKPLVADKLYELGRFGQKTGTGWYRYDDSRQPIPDPFVVELIRATAIEAGIAQRTINDQEIVERCIYALVNEGARIIEEGFAQRSSDIDVIYANGYGFPTWRGGPMFYADRVGLPTIHERVTAFHRQHGDRWAPAPLLEKLAMSGGSFRGLDRR